MYRNSVVFMILLSFGLMIHLSAGGGRTEEVRGNNGSEIGLSKHLHRLLKAEMNAVQQGMTNLGIAIPAGRFSDIARTAEMMNKGYIMRKKLSAKQMAAFLNSLPDDYHAMDREYHEAAGKMVQAAVEKDIAGVNSSFFKLYESCITCHSKYAKKRFSGFKKAVMRDQ